MGNQRSHFVYKNRLKKLKFGAVIDKQSVWSEKETELFIEGVRLYRRNYKLISEHVGSKNRH